MPTPFKISIPKPCHEQWDNMHKGQDGRFCGSCQKSVVDFTRFSDAELERWFIHERKISCGRFNPDQLDRLIENAQPFSLKRLKPNLILASFLAFLSFPKFGSANVIKPITYQTDGGFKNVLTANKELNQTDSLKVLKGKIIDRDDKSPLVGVAVGIDNNRLRVYTDVSGNFTIYIPEGFNSNMIDLQVRNIGYKAIDKTIDLRVNKDINLELCMSTEMLGGPELVYVRYSFKNRLYNNIKNHIKDINPFSRK